MIQLLFMVVLSVTEGYFLLRRRRFDFFSVAAFTTGFYFLPGIFGFVRVPRVGYPWGLPEPIVPGTYIVMMLVLLGILLGAFSYDLLSSGRQITISDEPTRRSWLFALILALIGVVGTIQSYGLRLLSPDKSDLIEISSRWFVVMGIASSLLLVFALVRGMKFLMILALALLLFDLLIGFRVRLATVVVAAIVILLSRIGEQRFLTRSWMVALGGLSAAVALSLYKVVYIPIKAGRWDLVAVQLTSLDSLIQRFTSVEPFLTQAILNEVIRTDFRVGPAHLLGVASQFMVFAPELGIQTVSFADLFQPRLFPEAAGGMANNIWAQMYSAGSWPLLIAFIYVYVIGLWIGSLGLRLSNREFRAGLSLLVAYWAFFIHRNDLLVQVNLERRILLVWCACVGGSLLIWWFQRRVLRSTGQSSRTA